ncbi:MAG: G1 family endopeptidase [Thermoplasmata archaeon]|nr:G1 family endopeptidase [Thermoplasmata archaeon]
MEPPHRTNVALPVLIAAVMLLSLGLTAVPSLGAHAAASSARGSSAAPNAPPNLAHLTALIHAKKGSAVVHGTSGNWAGFVNTVANTSYGSIQEVTAEWATPTVNCTAAPKGGAYQVQWIGIDGDGTGSVEQLGTLSDCSTTGATPAYYDWWEFYPYNGVTTVSSIGAGNLVQAYVLYNSAACVNSACGVYTLQMSDLSLGTSFSVTGGGWICNTGGVCEGGLDGSAECISEAPTGFGYPGITPVANYGTTTFYACADAIGPAMHGIGSWNSTSGVTIISLNQIGHSTKVDQKTGALVSYTYGKSRFTITWVHYA